jgi:hypothetical protein
MEDQGLNCFEFSLETDLCWIWAPDFGILMGRETRAMPDHSIHKATDLARDERLLVERWLGRALSNDETIRVTAYRPHCAPTGDEREVLRREIVTQAQEIGSRAQVQMRKTLTS